MKRINFTAWHGFAPLNFHDTIITNNNRSILNDQYFFDIGILYPGLEIKFFFQGAQMHLQKPLKGVVYRNQYIYGLPAADLREPQENSREPSAPGTPGIKG